MESIEPEEPVQNDEPDQTDGSDQTKEKSAQELAARGHYGFHQLSDRQREVIEAARQVRRDNESPDVDDFSGNGAGSYSDERI